MDQVVCTAAEQGLHCWCQGYSSDTERQGKLLCRDEAGAGGGGSGDGAGSSPSEKAMLHTDMLAQIWS
jgi:hypothetical protein